MCAMRALTFALAFLFSASGFAPASAQTAPRHVPPSDTTVPVGARLVLQVIGEGVQIYNCVQRDGIRAWTLNAPDAKLLDPASHQVLGIHGKGPMWQWNDGSAVSGKVARSQPSTEPGSMPWLLLAASPLGDQKGILSTVIWVRRSETHGGDVPASPCAEAQVGTTVRVAYSALYTFYSADTPVAR